MSTKPSKELDSFPNPNPEHPYLIEFDCPEFTCVCPLTGQPDFATFAISYVPDELCVELKSLKLYLWSYRDEGAFHEKVTNKIIEDIFQTVTPKFIQIRADWYVRGGIGTVVTVCRGESRFKEEALGA